jgi:hypothetical protein
MWYNCVMGKIKVCVVEGCGKPSGMPGTTRGFCKTHTSRWYRTGRLDTTRAPQGSGSIDAHGYRKIRINGKQVREHRYIIEQVLGRPLDPHEVIHHIDGNKLNNNPDNLLVCSQSQHRKEHATFRNETHKECAKCHAIKPRWQFKPEKVKKGCNPENFDPHYSLCRDCQRLREREHSKEKWQRTKARESATKSRKCLVCGADFIPVSPQKMCSEQCRRERQRQHGQNYRQSHPEYVQKKLQRNKEWRKANPERVAIYKKRERIKRQQNANEI